MAEVNPTILNPSGTLGAVFLDPFSPVQLWEREFFPKKTYLRKRGPGITLPGGEEDGTDAELPSPGEDELPSLEEELPLLEEELPSLEDELPSLEDELPSLEDELPALEEAPEESQWPMRYETDDSENDPTAQRLEASDAYRVYEANTFGKWIKHKYQYHGGLAPALKAALNYDLTLPMQALPPAEHLLMEEVLDRIDAFENHVTTTLSEMFPAAFGDDKERRRKASQAWMRSKDVARGKNKAARSTKNEEPTGSGLESRIAAKKAKAKK